MKPRDRLFFFAAALLFFACSFRSYFVCDDFEFLGRINFRNAGNYFTHSWGYGNEYRPLLVFSYALDAALGGRDPFIYHVMNTLLHAANALLAAAVVRRMSPVPYSPLVMASIFLVNPVSHESVLWISGRPVILSAFFGLLAIWASARAVESRGAFLWWGLVYTSFLASLLTYEGAVTVPLLLLLVHSQRTAGNGLRQVRGHMLSVSVLTAAYLIGWNLFFHFTITRFPVEHSASDAAYNLAKALGHSFHGSSRVAVAMVYLFVTFGLVIRRGGRRLLVIAFVWFMIAYLPFFMVRGYADRFSYLSSAAVAFVLAGAVKSIPVNRRVVEWSAAVLVVGILAIGMVGRMIVWRQAGEMGRSVPSEIRRLHPYLPSNSTLVLLHVPGTYRDAYVFLTGIGRAVQLEYGDPSLRVFQQFYPHLPTNTVVVDCAGGVVTDVN